MICENPISCYFVLCVDMDMDMDMYCKDLHIIDIYYISGILEFLDGFFSGLST